VKFLAGLGCRGGAETRGSAARANLGFSKVVSVSDHDHDHDVHVYD
jgi:hypothetical protein